MGLMKSKQTTKEDFKVRVQEYNARLQTALIGCSQAKTTFTTLSDLWFNSRNELVSTLTSVAEEIDRHHHNVNIASLTGTSSSIAGGTAAIAGLVLSPFTGGLSVALTAGGLVGTVAGSATTLGANIAEVYLTKELIERARRVLETDATYTEALKAAFHELVIHESEVVTILEELKEESFTLDLQKLLKADPFKRDSQKRPLCTRCKDPFEDVFISLVHLYPDDKEFLQQLNKTNSLFSESPSLSSALSSSSGFFQAMKELNALGPETIRSLTESALQSSVSSTTQMASLGAQLLTVGLEAVFVALDVYQFIKTSRSMDEGSKTELSEKIREVIRELESEKDQVAKLSEFYKRQADTKLLHDTEFFQSSGTQNITA